MIRVLFAAPSKDWEEYREVLPKAISDAGIAAEIVLDTDAPKTIDYIVYAPSSRLRDFAPFSNCKAVLNLWAGVEKIVGNETLTMPLTRMVDFGLTEGMVEWCVGHVLRHHLDLDRDICRTDSEWAPHVPPLARNRSVGVLGLGALGSAVAEALAALRFRVSGWSRSPKALPNVDCFDGDAGLNAVLSRSEILVLLLPQTPGTRDLMNAERLAAMPQDSVIINPGRGPLIVDEDLLAALDSDHLKHATLDVFRTEPLPSDHAFWSHPKVTVTPHVASDTRAGSAAEQVAENIRRSEAGEPLLHLVDRGLGY